MVRAFLLSVFFVFSFLSFAQGSTYLLEKAEERLYKQLTELRNTRNDAQLDALNEQFSEEVKKVLEMEGAFDYPFASLNTMGKIYSDDKLIRIFSWNVQYEDLSHDFKSFILKKDERRGKVSVIELKRQKQHLNGLQFETIGADNWYGALYYDVIDVKRRNRTYYTLLAYDPNNQRSSIKLIDVLYFTGNQPHFGAAIFDARHNRATRIIFEHSAEATMSLRYDKQRKMIIFDHLSPESPTMKEFREFYVPDMSYDAYQWDGKQWNLLEDIIAVNKAGSGIVELKAYDSDRDTVVTIPTKEQWINPEDTSAPIDGGTHRAVVPEDLEGDKKSTKKEKGKKVKKDKKFKDTPRSAIKPSKPVKRKR